ncbi:hypothetical protein BESB_076810 [Besnoitia besnoiti]|uniref:Hflx-type G domain-containing protein n=1 Tax=Besnoitia besnoiti TaxID=94643 RepID=A0A2A9M8H4_BESBE|nr:hypothetical protein BESB_076810 [Besnoitia besnoiti]PFH33464.1 hypothetical protein BESB_076810 [Besnoitia besnoiti]
MARPTCIQVNSDRRLGSARLRLRSSASLRLPRPPAPSCLLQPSRSRPSVCSASASSSRPPSASSPFGVSASLASASLLASAVSQLRSLCVPSAACFLSASSAPSSAAFSPSPRSSSRWVTVSPRDHAARAFACALSSAPRRGELEGSERAAAERLCPPRNCGDEAPDCEPSREQPEVLLLHVLFKGGPRGHVKGMRKKTKEEILWEAREAICLARAASWRVVPGPGSLAAGGRDGWQWALWEERDECDEEDETLECARSSPPSDLSNAARPDPASAPTEAMPTGPGVPELGAALSASARPLEGGRSSADSVGFPASGEQPSSQDGVAVATTGRPSAHRGAAEASRDGEGEGEGEAELSCAGVTRRESEAKRRRFKEEDEEIALAESCVVVVRQESPQFLFGKGKVGVCLFRMWGVSLKSSDPTVEYIPLLCGASSSESFLMRLQTGRLSAPRLPLQFRGALLFLSGALQLQELVSFFGRRPTPFVFINCSSAFTSVPLPESLAESYAEGGRSPDSPSERDGAAGQQASSAASPLLHGQYGYYSRNRTIAGRLMMSSSTDKSSAGLRPVQLEYLQQAFEASLAGAAASFDELRRRERARGCFLPACSASLARYNFLLPSSGAEPAADWAQTDDDEATAAAGAEAWRGEGADDAAEGEAGGEESDGEDLEEANTRILEWLKRREKVQVVDRQRVILEIFTTQARNKKAMLQVALARVAYLRSRLLSGSEVRRRQLYELIYGAAKIRGCAPGAEVSQWLGEVTEQYVPSPRGPKEDFERQYVDSIMKRLRSGIAREAATLAYQRRNRSGLPCLAFVGYTNAGKSRLINALTKDGQLQSADRLFCTLDTKMKHLRLPNGAKCVVMDSIGFIQGLPLSLCGAFQSTLDELQHADLLLHVVDVSHPMWQHQRRVVLQALYQNAKTVEAKQEKRPGFEEHVKAQRRELLRQQLQTPLPALSRFLGESAGPRGDSGRNHAGAEGEDDSGGDGSPRTDAEARMETLLHAVDAEQAFEETKLVERVMGGKTRILEVWTKVDLVESDARMEAIARMAPPNAVLVSAKDGTGLRFLTHMLEEAVAATGRGRRVRLARVQFPVEHSRGVFAFISQNCHEADFEITCASDETDEKNPKGVSPRSAYLAPRTMSVHVRASAEQLRQLLKKFPACAIRLVDEEKSPPSLGNPKKTD